MSSYCECGHVLSEHMKGLDHCACLGDGGTCGCSHYTEIPAEELERGWD